MLTGLYTSETPLQTSYFIPQVSYESSISYLTPSSNRIYSRLNILRSKKLRGIRLQKRTFKVSRKIITKTSSPTPSFDNCYRSPHNTTQFIINSYESNEVLSYKYSNLGENFGSMMGLVNNESLCEESGGKNEENKEFGADIEEILQIAKVEKDPFRLFILINRLANMVKEKDEQISLLKRKISECQESSQLH